VGKGRFCFILPAHCCAAAQLYLQTFNQLLTSAIMFITLTTLLLILVQLLHTCEMGSTLHPLWLCQHQVYERKQISLWMNQLLGSFDAMSGFAINQEKMQLHCI